MAYTTVPTIIITLIVFIILGFTFDTSGTADTESILVSIRESFHISGWLFIVPAAVIFLLIRKTHPLIALLIGTLLGAVFAVIFQPEVLLSISGADELNFKSTYQAIMNAITVDTAIESTNATLTDLFTSGGMYGMLGTIWLIICAMVFGGVMDAIGALSTISAALLNGTYSFRTFCKYGYHLSCTQCNSF